MKYYAVIDTNVIVSAFLNWDSVPSKILQYVFSNTITPVLNEKIISEYEEVLNRPKFHFPKDSINILLKKIRSISLFVNGNIKISIDMPDKKDIVFYQVVMEKRQPENAYLITGNIKHFPKESFVVTPREMLDLIES